MRDVGGLQRLNRHHVGDLGRSERETLPQRVMGLDLSATARRVAEPGPNSRRSIAVFARILRCGVNSRLGNSQRNCGN